jgi:hypothetical protein
MKDCKKCKTQAQAVYKTVVKGKREQNQSEDF